jgi:hypothetical protein
MIKTQKAYIEQITYFLQSILVSRNQKYDRTTRGGERIKAQDVPWIGKPYFWRIRTLGASKICSAVKNKLFVVIPLNNIVIFIIKSRTDLPESSIWI